MSSSCFSIRSSHIPCPNGMLATLSSGADDILISSRCWRENALPTTEEVTTISRPGPWDPGPGTQGPFPRVSDIDRGGCGFGNSCTTHWDMEGISSSFSMRAEDWGLPRSEQGARRWEVREKEQLHWSRNYTKITDETTEAQRTQATFSRSHSL